MKDGIDERIIKRHPDSKTKIRKLTIRLTKMRRSGNSHLQKLNVCAIVVERKDIYPLFADKMINQRQNDISQN